MTVLLVTCAAMPGLHEDDRYLLRGLRERGVSSEPAVWEDRLRDWNAASLCVIRSAWDYSYRRDAFVRWAHRVAGVAPMHNSADLVEWNTHKRYLVDLAHAGVPTVPTVVLESGNVPDVAGLLKEHGWESAVLKAAVAQTGRYAMLVTRDTLDAGQAHVERILPHEDMLLQPLIERVPERGEASLVFIDGEFTHAVRKRGTADTFMVHDDYGGSVRPTRPRRGEMAVAEAALDTLEQPPLYARVDVVRDGERPVLMEFELVEPELFFRYSPAAVDRFLDAIQREVRTAS
jgi:glutathione synthase/RimK-type ligase-like ATP-grasp enzyme